MSNARNMREAGGRWTRGKPEIREENSSHQPPVYIVIKRNFCIRLGIAMHYLWIHSQTAEKN